MTIAIYLAVLAAPGAATELPLFDFKDVRAGEQVVPRAQFTGCEVGERGETSCITLNDTLAGGPANVVWTFVDDKLSRVYVSMKRDRYPEVATAFAAKYGKPCDTRTETWQNNAGATFQGAVTRWCFRTGKLELSQFGSKVTESRAVYVDESNVVPDARPKVDF